MQCMVATGFVTKNSLNYRLAQKAIRFISIMHSNQINLARDIEGSCTYMPGQRYFSTFTRNLASVLESLKQIMIKDS